MDTSALAAEIVSRSLLKGDFRLRSGRTSTEYFDKYQFEADPQLLSSIADQLLGALPKDAEVLAGLEVGGIPLATALSMKSGLPLAIVRKQRKEYGTGRLVEGQSVAARRTVIIEDVITSGGQVLASAQDLRELGATVTAVLCVVDRELGGRDALAASGLELRPLFRASELQLPTASP